MAVKQTPQTFNQLAYFGNGAKVKGKLEIESADKLVTADGSAIGGTSDNLVTTDSEQTITATKTFASAIKLSLRGASTTYDFIVGNSLQYFTIGLASQPVYCYSLSNGTGIGSSVYCALFSETSQSDWIADFGTPIGYALGSHIYVPIKSGKHYLACTDDIPTPLQLPTSSADGTYVLKATKSGSTITYTWVAE